MKLYLVIFSCLISTIALGQRKIWYTSAGGDGSIFSLADVEMDGRNVNPILRWSPVFNFGTNLNWDFSEKVGLYGGWNIRNIGMITRDSLGQQDKFKRRVYMFGVPVGLKLGNLQKQRFVFLGGEIGFPFHYKQKFFPNGNKSEKVRTREWFSERVNPITTAVFLGFHFSNRTTFKVQYFTNNFFNQDYAETSPGGAIVRPYANYRSNIFYFTFGYDFRVRKVFDKKTPDSTGTDSKPRRKLFGD
jgi:hypothetical protein